MGYRGFCFIFSFMLCAGNALAQELTIESIAPALSCCEWQQAEGGQSLPYIQPPLPAQINNLNDAINCGLWQDKPLEKVYWTCQFDQFENREYIKNFITLYQLIPNRSTSSVPFAGGFLFQANGLRIADFKGEQKLLLMGQTKDGSYTQEDKGESVYINLWDIDLTQVGRIRSARIYKPFWQVPIQDGKYNTLLTAKYNEFNQTIIALVENSNQKVVGNQGDDFGLAIYQLQENGQVNWVMTDHDQTNQVGVSSSFNKDLKDLEEDSLIGLLITAKGKLFISGYMNLDANSEDKEKKWKGICVSADGQSTRGFISPRLPIYIPNLITNGDGSLLAVDDMPPEIEDHDDSWSEVTLDAVNIYFASKPQLIFLDINTDCDLWQERQIIRLLPKYTDPPEYIRLFHASRTPDGNILLIYNFDLYDVDANNQPERSSAGKKDALIAALIRDDGQVLWQKTVVDWGDPYRSYLLQKRCYENDQQQQVCFFGGRVDPIEISVVYPDQKTAWISVSDSGWTRIFLDDQDLLVEEHQPRIYQLQLGP